MSEVKIEELQLGQGKTAKRGSLIQAHYRGFLEDGTEFDSSYTHGEPFEVILSTNRVIQGWIFGLQGMQEGGKRRIWVPAELGYGARQVGGIPANANLIFEIELLDVKNRDE